VLARGGFDFAWLLNNDTVLAPGALRALTDAASADPGLGMVGSKLLYYHRPDTVQALGGAEFNAWLALPRHVGEHDRADEAPDGDPTARMRFVVGASMLVPVAFLRDVGLMSEEYFLYFEEMDWAMRARGRWRVGYAAGSVVYHKEGASIGRGAQGGEKSYTADFHFMRSRLLFTRKFFPRRLPAVYLALGVAMLRRARHRRWDRVRMIAKLCLNR
jgi:GT2 family glycosyltransferase